MMEERGSQNDACCNGFYLWRFHLSIKGVFTFSSIFIRGLTLDNGLCFYASEWAFSIFYFLWADWWTNHCLPRDNTNLSFASTKKRYDESVCFNICKYYLANSVRHKLIVCRARCRAQCGPYMMCGLIPKPKTIISNKHFIPIKRW